MLVLLVYLSGEGSGLLGRVEVEELGEAYHCPVRVEDRLATIEDCGKDFVWRLAYAKLAGKIISEGNLDELEVLMADPYFKEDHTGFAVNVWKLDTEVDSSELKKKFGNLISGKPNLSDPKEIFDIFVKGERIWITIRIWENDPKDFAKRHPQRKPAFHPTSLKPKIARWLINLSGLKPGQSLLDPFCGVGGILVEACLLGIKSTGVELDKRWAEGARRNLEYYGIENARVINEDFFKWENGQYDAIVTDLPYGRSSKMQGETLNFYEHAFEKFAEHSNKAVVMGPMNLEKTLERCGWYVKRKLSLPVHKSLERWVHICLR